MALPAIIKLLPKLLPAAKLAYDHRDKAMTLYTNIKQWRSKEEPRTLTTEDKKPAMSTEEQIEELHTMIAQRDDIITQQSDILARMANDISELSILTEKLRRRSQWLQRALLIALLIWAIRSFFF